MSTRQPTKHFIPFGQPFIFRRANEPTAKRVQIVKLRAACQAAFVFIEDYRLELMGSYCLSDADDNPIRDSVDPGDESDHLREVETLLDQLTRALQGFML